jgi:hypothetical protein
MRRPWTRCSTQQHEAVVEHAGAKALIAQIQSMSPRDDYYEPGGMFAEARKSVMDLEELSEQLIARKQQLESTAEAA